MGRSSTRHQREVQGIDVDLKQAGEFGEYNDFTALNTSPQSGDGINTGVGPAVPAPQSRVATVTKPKRRRKKEMSSDDASDQTPC